MRGTVQLPLKPYLHKFLCKKLNCQNNEIDLSFSDPIAFGLVVSQYMNRKRSYNVFRKEENIDKFIETKCTSTITLNLKNYHYHDTGFNISSDAVFYINKYLDRMFRNEVFIFINAQTLYYPHIVITYAMDDFFSVYSITENDLSKQTFCKIYQRYKREYSYLKLI